MYLITPTLAFILVSAPVVFAQNSSAVDITPSGNITIPTGTAAGSGGSATVPYYSAPNTFAPTFTGETGAPGSIITIINSNGAGSLTDTFIYTAAASTISPYPTGGPNATSNSQRNLQPDPTHLQIVPSGNATSAASTLNSNALKIGSLVGLIGVGMLAI